MTDNTSMYRDQKKQHAKRVCTKTITELFLLAIVIIGIIPLCWVIFLSLKTNKEIFFDPLCWPADPMWENYVIAFQRIPWFKMLKNTFTEMLFAIPIGMAFTFMSSFAISRVRFGNDKWNDTFYLYFLAGIIVPGFVTLFPLYMIINKLGLYDNLAGLVLIHISGGATMNTVILVNAMRSIPSELEEAAVIDGAGVWKLLKNIYLPLTKPTLVTIFILSFIGIWNDYVLAKTMLINNKNSTISMAAALFKGLYAADYSTMTAAIVILVIPQIAIFSLLQKQIVDGITAGAVKG